MYDTPSESMGLGVSMTELRKAAQMALWALRYINQYSLAPHNIALPGEIDTAVDALRAALAQTDEKFCDDNCTWRDHHPDCAIAKSLALPDSEGGEV